MIPIKGAGSNYAQPSSAGQDTAGGRNSVNPQSLTRSIPFSDGGKNPIPDPISVLNPWRLQPTSDYRLKLDAENIAAMVRISTERFAAAPAQRYEFPLVLPSGYAATLTGDAIRQNIRCSTPHGMIEVNVGPDGPESVRGLHSRSDTSTFLNQLMTSQGWDDVRPLPPG